MPIPPELQQFIDTYAVPVFPCNAGKHPITAHGFKDASRDRGQLEAWAAAYPGCLWGMPTGQVTGFLVTDLDIKPEQGKHGDEAWLRLCAGRAVPPTPVVLTPSGGAHLYWRLPAGVETRSCSDLAKEHIGAGLDIRGDGGFVVIPPSAINGTSYQWEASTDPADVPFAEAPPWLLELCRRKPANGADHGAEFTHASKLAALLAAIVEGSPLHDSLRDAAAVLAAKGLSRHDIEAMLRVALVASKAPRDARYRERWEEIPKLVASALAKFRSPEPATDQSWPAALDLAALSAQVPAAPQFILPDWLPAGYATLLAGHGGVGKSGIGLHMAVCMALGRDAFGIPTARRRVSYLSCEDRAAVLHWRLTHICTYLGVNLAELAGWLDVRDLVGRDVLLWARDPRTGFTVTPAFERLAEQVRLHEPQVLWIDGVSDTFGGNENARTEVKAYVNRMLQLIPLDGALVLLGHVAKPAASGVATSEGYSGSTQWHNAVRARWYLYPQTESDEDGGRPRHTGKLTLELQKSNLGKTDQSIDFVWDEAAHMFVPVDAGAMRHFDRRQLEETERDGIRNSLHECATVSCMVPAAAQGRRTAFNVLASRPEFPASLKRSPRRFWAHIETLRQLGLIEEREYRRADGHKAVQLALTAKGFGELANIKN